MKTELVLRQAKLESERHDRQTVELALCAQVVEAGKRKDEAMATVQEASEKAEILKKECDGNLGSFLLNCFLTSIFLFQVCLISSYCLDQLFVEISRSSWRTLRK
jgi:hypothetical protein